MTKKVLTLLLCLILSLTALTACNQDGGGIGGNQDDTHTHTFADEWRYDASEHWHTATCEHVDEVADKGAHEDKDGNDICDICGYIADHTHTYEDTLTQGEDTHYYKAACGHNVKKDEAKHTDENNDGACDVCAYNGGHEHTYEEGWTALEDGHWHIPSCGHSVDGIGKEAHKDENNDGDCDVCSYNGGHEHTYAEEWSNTGDEHWREVTCGHSVSVADKGVHVDENGDTTCDLCGYTPEHFHAFDEGWTSDASGHWHKATCGHDDIRKDEATHDGYETDGVCDTCAYVVFRLFNVTVTLPEYVTMTAPDGSNATSFIVKENTEVTFQLHIPTYAEMVKITGASVVGDPVLENEINTYTVKLNGVTADTSVALVTNKLAAVDVIVSDGKGSIAITDAFKYFYEDITFNAPTAGRYMIFSTTDEWVHFGIGEMGDDGYPIYKQVYFLDVETAGDATVQARYFPWSVPDSGKLDYSYVIAKVDGSLTLKSLVSDGYTLPTNVDTTVRFTAPKAGRYQISSSLLGLSWNDYICNSIILVATEDNQEMSFTVRYDNTTAPSFVFDCFVTYMEPDALKTGENTVIVPFGQYKALSFTADQTGSYNIRVTDPYVRLYGWNEETQTMMGQGISYTIDELEAGSSFTLYVGLDTYDYTGTDDITDIIILEYLGYVPPYENGGYTAMVNVSNSYVSSYEASDFVLSVPANAQISIDGGKSWHKSVRVSVGDYGTVTYLVKSTNGSGTVQVTVERIAYEFTLNVGEQTQTLIPGVEYLVYLNGSTNPAYYVDYLLYWNNEDVTVAYNAGLLSSGDTVISYSTFYTLVIVNTGSQTANVQFSLVDPYTGEDDSDIPGNPTNPDLPVNPDVPVDTILELGENSVYVQVENYYCEGTQVTFTAPTAGTYVLAAAVGETNAEVFLTTENITEMIVLPYEFTASAGETVTFHVSTTAYMTLTSDSIDLVITKK